MNKKSGDTVGIWLLLALRAGTACAQERGSTLLQRNYVEVETIINPDVMVVKDQTPKWLSCSWNGIKRSWGEHVPAFLNAYVFMTNGLSRWLHTLPTHSVITFDVIVRSQGRSRSCLAPLDEADMAGTPLRSRIAASVLKIRSCAQGQKPSSSCQNLYACSPMKKNDTSWTAPLPPLYCLLTRNWAGRRRFTFHSCLLPVSLSDTNTTSLN